MKIVKITRSGFECERCTHQWIPHKERDKPKVCPDCKSPYWDTPKRK